MQKWSRLGFLAVLLGAVFTSPGNAQGPPIPLDIEREDIPNTGRNGIEFSAPLGSCIKYRPRDTREVHGCHMSTGLTGVVDGIDAFDIDRMTLVRVVLPRMRRTEENTVKCSEGDKEGG
jgi:hypothetical protein